MSPAEKRLVISSLLVRPEQRHAIVSGGLGGCERDDAGDDGDDGGITWYRIAGRRTAMLVHSRSRLDETKERRRMQEREKSESVTCLRIRAHVKSNDTEVLNWSKSGPED